MIELLLTSLDSPLFLAGYAVVGGYFFGSVPFGLLLVYLKDGVDLRKQGSGNIGATNVLRSSGKIMAVLTVIADSGKAALAAFIGFCFADFIGVFSGLSAIIGHNFSCFLKFKGGKGVASSLGFLLVVNGFYGILGCAIWLLVMLLFRVSSFAALVSFLAIFLIAIFWKETGETIGLIFLLTSLIFIRHHGNIRRLIRLQEPQIGSSGKMFSLKTPVWQIQKIAMKMKNIIIKA